MFSLENIQEAHSKVKSGADFPKYIQDIKALGVAYYETFVADGHTAYFNDSDQEVIAPAKFDAQIISDVYDGPTFTNGLKAHQQGQASYPEFIKMCAETGVEKWQVAMSAMSCTYFDKQGNNVLEESIPS